MAPNIKEVFNGIVHAAAFLDKANVLEAKIDKLVTRMEEDHERLVRVELEVKHF